MMAAVWDNDEESLTELGLEECVESGMRERIVPCICACAGGTGKTKSAAASSLRLQAWVHDQTATHPSCRCSDLRLYPAAWSHGGPKGLAAMNTARLLPPVLSSTSNTDHHIV